MVEYEAKLYDNRNLTQVRDVEALVVYYSVTCIACIQVLPSCPTVQTYSHFLRAAAAYQTRQDANAWKIATCKVK